MRNAIPGCTLRGTPHINSKITVWKRHQASLSSMISLGTGVGFNHLTHKIEALDSQWETVVKNDPAAHGMRYKPWPMHEAWMEIFGKDRANGGGAEDLREAVNELIAEDVPSPTVTPMNDEADPESPRNEREVNSHSKKKNSGTKLSGSKRHASDLSDDRIVETLQQMQRSTEEGLQSITRVLQYESNLGETRQNLFSMLDELEDFSLDEKLAASHMLAKNTECLEMFTGLPNHARHRYVRCLLKNELT